MTEQTLEQAIQYLIFLDERMEQRQEERRDWGNPKGRLIGDYLIGGYRCVKESVYRRFPQLRPTE